MAILPYLRHIQSILPFRDSFYSTPIGQGMGSLLANPPSLKVQIWVEDEDVTDNGDRITSIDLVKEKGEIEKSETFEEHKIISKPKIERIRKWPIFICRQRGMGHSNFKESFILIPD